MGFPNKGFVKIKVMLKSDLGKNHIISYSFFSSQFGKMIVASSTKGVCYIGYALSYESALQDLQHLFPKNSFRQQKNKSHEQVKEMFAGKWKTGEKLLLCLKGTPFQLKVWEALLTIPTGSLTSYGKIAAAIGYPKAQRAVGTAVGRNPILYIIPCHRVIAQNGKLGGFFWGIDKKIELLNWENAGGYLHFTS